MKWIAHRWPNFSVDFPKLISRCILVWIPNENCVKIGKSLIRWNGKIPLPHPQSSSPTTPSLCFSICYERIFIVLWSAYTSWDQISNMSHLSVLYFRASRDSQEGLITNTNMNPTAQVWEINMLCNYGETENTHKETVHKQWQTSTLHTYIYSRCVTHTHTIIQLSAQVQHTSCSCAHTHRQTPLSHTDSRNKFAKQQMSGPHSLLCIASLICFLTHVCWINYFQRGVW